jgi:hypothetical protein
MSGKQIVGTVIAAGVLIAAPTTVGNFAGAAIGSAIAVIGSIGDSLPTGPESGNTTRPATPAPNPDAGRTVAR